MPARSRLGERACLSGRRARAFLAQTAVAGEAPGAADEHAHTDPLALAVVETLDSLVAGADDLGPAHDHARIGVRRSSPESRGHRLVAELPHAAYLSGRGSHEWKAWLQCRRALVAELVDAQG